MRAMAFLIVLGGGLLGCTPAIRLDRIPDASAMAEGPLVPAPPGWIDYCRRHAEDPSCRP